MKNILIAGAVLLLLTSRVFASEVYIDQAGGSLTVDVLQENGSNRINTESNPAILDGDDINVAVIQRGDGNAMDLVLDAGANNTNFVYSSAGDMNTIIANVYGGIENDFTATLIGSDNAVTACKDYTNSVCNGIIVNATKTTLSITGSNNEVNLAYDSANATNNINIGSNVSSSYNVVNLTQTTSNGYNSVNLVIDGDSNIIDVLQN